MSTQLLVLFAGIFLATSWVPADVLFRLKPEATSGELQEASKPGIIRGRITAAATAKPLRRASVTLLVSSASATRAGIAASTNSQGLFELKDVPPGSYFVSVSRAGYLTMQYGQRAPGERGTAIEVGAGQTVERIDIALSRGGVLAGRIVDELGAPYPGVRVMALDLRYRLGRRTPFPAGSANTDDLGQYRIPSLQPGSYYVSASSGETWQNERKESFGYATTYYPGVAADAAQVVTLGVAQERRDLDFTLSMSRTARVRGRVLRPDGAPLAGETVTLVLTIRGNAGLIITGNPLTARTEADGTFEFRNVAPADYRVIKGGSEYASAFVAVSGDVDNVILVPRRGSTLSGTVVTGEGGPPPFPASGVRFNLIAPEDNVLPTVRAPAVNNDWSFRLENLGGKFLFRAMGIPDDWMLDAVRLDDQDLVDVPYDVPTGGREITGMQVVLTNKVGTIAGEVVSADRKPARDATVIVFSEDADQWIPGSRWVRTTRPTSDGRFSIAGLPAGTYLAVARDFIIDGQWEDKEFLDGLRQDAAKVILTPGSPATVTLKLPAVR